MLPSEEILAFSSSELMSGYLMMVGAITRQSDDLRRKGGRAFCLSFFWDFGCLLLEEREGNLDWLQVLAAEYDVVSMVSRSLSDAKKLLPDSFEALSGRLRLLLEIESVFVLGFLADVPGIGDDAMDEHLVQAIFGGGERLGFAPRHGSLFFVFVMILV